MATRHLNQAEVAARWGFSPRTLENWRSRGKGPEFLKIGRKVVYELEAIEAFEREQRRGATPRVHHRGSQAGPPEIPMD